MACLFKDKARVMCETADFLLLLKPEQRTEMRKAILNKMKEAKWEQVREHTQRDKEGYFLFEVNNEAYESTKATTNADEEEDYMDLTGL